MKIDRNDFLIPGEAVEACGFALDAPLCFHAGPDALIVVPGDMTAMQAVNAIDALTELSTELICAILTACDRCDKGCPDGCPYEDVTGPEATLSDAVRKEAGIPPEEKLCVEAGDGEVRISAAGFAHDLTDVPDSVREALVRAGVCQGSLEELLMDNEVIVHG